MSQSETDAERLRARIDEIDESILTLMGERRRLGSDLAAHKRESGAPVRDVARERAVLARFIRDGKAQGLSQAFSQKLGELLIDESLRGQRGRLDAKARGGQHSEASVAYLGGPGAYSHAAAEAHFADRYHGVQPVPCRDFPSIIRTVEESGADYGLLPIENTTTGGISEVYDLLMESRLTIVGEHHLKVEHSLVGRAASPGSVRNVYGHPQALGQSQRFFKKRPDIATHFVSSTTRALELAMEGDETVAAVAGAEAAALFGLNVIERGISDHAENYTRFVAVALDADPPPQELPCKTTVAFETADTPGALVKVLNAFAEAGINLTKLESRPIPGDPWNEMFFIDFEAHRDASGAQAALAVLTDTAGRARVLGCYGADRLAPTAVDLDAEPASA